jgi:chemotaxis protein methyltransferase CheR
VSWTHPAYEAVARLLGERTGLSFPPARQDSAEQGIRQAMARAGINDPNRYRALLAAGEVSLDDLIGELTIGETYFFREPGQFAFLRREVLPDLRRRAAHPVRAWSAGCASGEEAYSLAILFAEEGLTDAFLLATDISRAALAAAQRATYSAWSLRGEDGQAGPAHAPRAAPYLQRRGDRYLLSERIRQRVTFAILNLALDVYPSFATSTWGMDLILCRNVLIYFDRQTIQDVARRLFAALAPGGWLLTAASDPPLADHAPFQTVMTDAGLVYRRPSEDDKVTGWQGDKVTEEAPLSQPAPPDHPVTRSAPRDPLAEAESALACGAYARAAELTRGLEDPRASALHVRALANLDPARAERACASSIVRHPLAAELHHLHALLLVLLGRDDEAATAARRVLYLDRSLAVAHLTLGSILYRRGEHARARRAYRTAYDLCAARPADEVVPLSEGEHAGRLAEAAAAQLALLEATP